MPFGPGRLPAGLAAWQPQVIIYSGRDDLINDFEPWLKAGIPLIAITRLARTDIPVVISDADLNFRLVHQHFGDRVASIALFVTGDAKVTRPLSEAYESFARTNGMRPNVFAYGDIGDIEEIRVLSKIESSFGRWLKEQPKPLGIFAFTTHMGLFLSRACQMMKLRIPQDVMIIGTDDFDVANEAVPPNTSLRLAMEEIGARAVQLGCDLLDGAPPPKEIVRVPGTTIIGRRSTASQPKGWNLDSAMTFIEEHACEGVNVSTVWKQTQSITREEFQRRFRAAVGETPRHVLEMRRMSEAKRLLLETEMSIGMIAGICGYPDYMHFYKLFRKLNGIGPKEFRENAS